jgi:hypothetical protein
VLTLAAASELRQFGGLASVRVQDVAAQSEVKADCFPSGRIGEFGSHAGFGGVMCSAHFSSPVDGVPL